MRNVLYGLLLGLSACSPREPASPSEVGVPLLSVTAGLSEIDLPQGASIGIDVSIAPTPSQTDVHLAVANLPAGATAEPLTLAAGAAGVLVLHADAAAPQTDWESVVLVATPAADPITVVPSATVPLPLRIRGAPGALDTLFKDGGRILMSSLFTNSPAHADDVSVSPTTGYIRVAGGAGRCGNDGNGNATAWCMNFRQFAVDDGSYGGGGWGTFATGAYSFSSRILHVPGGDYLLGGVTSYPTQRLVLSRWDPFKDGEGGGHDDTFGNDDGAATTAFGVPIVPSDVVLDANGFLHGATVGGQAVVVHYSHAGLPDGYGTGGRFVFNWAGAGEALRGLAVDPSNRAIATGNLAGDGFGVARLTDAGALDPSFGNAGVVTVPTGRVNDVAILPSGVIMTCGSRSSTSGPEAFLFALSDAGIPVASFGSSGMLALTSPNETSCESVEIDAAGRIVLTGLVSPDTAGGTLLARYLADGSSDTAFNGLEPYRASLPGLSGSALTFDADGMILVSGTLGDDGFVARYWP